MASGRLLRLEAEKVRFELTVPFDTSVFKTDTLNHSVTSPVCKYQKRESNPHALRARDFKSLVSTCSTILA